MVGHAMRAPGRRCAAPTDPLLWNRCASRSLAAALLIHTPSRDDSKDFEKDEQAEKDARELISAGKGERALKDPAYLAALQEQLYKEAGISFDLGKNGVYLEKTCAVPGGSTSWLLNVPFEGKPSGNYQNRGNQFRLA
jgi:hypothetical protein